MAQFLGCWKLDRNSYTNFDEFCKVSGFPDDMIDKFRNMETTIELKKDGDMWSYEIKSSIMPDKVVKFKSGEEVLTDFMGKDVKFTITFESDSKLKQIEASALNDWKPMTITREVKGDVMHCTNEIDGVQMTLQLTRC